MEDVKPCGKCVRDPDVQTPYESDRAGKWRVYCDECAQAAYGRDEADAIYNWNRKPAQNSAAKEPQ